MRFYTGRIKNKAGALFPVPSYVLTVTKLLNWRSNSKMFIYEQESNSRRP